MKRLVAVVLGLGVLAGSARAQSGELLALSKKDHTLAIVDGETLKVKSKVPVGNDPHEVIASSDGKTAYVSNYGSGMYHTLAVVDLAGVKALPPIDLGAMWGPHGLAFVGGKTWFTSEVTKAIGRYDPATNKIDLILGTGQNRIHMVWVSQDQQRIVATNVTSKTVSIIDREPVQTLGPAPGNRPGGAASGSPDSKDGKDWNETQVSVGVGGEGFDVSPDGRELWVANAGDGTISVIDLAQKKVVETLQVNVKAANRLKFTRDGKRVLVSMLGTPNLAVLDAGTRKVVKRLTIGTGSAGILMEPNGNRAFVACSPDNYIAVIDLKTLAVIGKIEVGENPDGMDWVAR